MLCPPSLQMKLFKSFKKEGICSSVHMGFCLKGWAWGVVYIWLQNLHNNCKIRADSGFSGSVQHQRSKAKINSCLKAGKKTSCPYRDGIRISKWESVPLLLEVDCYKNILVKYISVPRIYDVKFKKNHIWNWEHSFIQI